jgi:hypothetical protein
MSSRAAEQQTGNFFNRVCKHPKCSNFEILQKIFVSAPFFSFFFFFLGSQYENGENLITIISAKNLLFPILGIYYLRFIILFLFFLAPPEFVCLFVLARFEL